MKLPKGFDLYRALELARQSNDAYTQYSCYEKSEKWSGPKGYKLELELELQSDYENKHLPLGFIASRGGNIYVS